MDPFQLTANFQQKATTPGLFAPSHAMSDSIPAALFFADWLDTKHSPNDVQMNIQF